MESGVVRPPYPPSLTVKSWEKAKGLIARISGVKTGITELLVKAEKEFHNAPWDEALSTKPLAKVKSQGLEALKKWHVENNIKYSPVFRKLQATYADLSHELNQKARNFESDPKLAKFAPVLKKMADDANKFTYAVAWGTVSSTLGKEVVLGEKALEERAKKANERIKLIIPTLEKIENKFAEYKKGPPTTKEYAGLFAQYQRMPGTYIATVAKDLPELKEVFGRFLAYADKHWRVEPPAKTDMKKRVAEDLVEVEKCKKLVEQLLKK